MLIAVKIFGLLPDPVFSSDKGKVFIIEKALYGLAITLSALGLGIGTTSISQIMIAFDLVGKFGEFGIRIS